MVKYIKIGMLALVLSACSSSVTPQRIEKALSLDIDLGLIDPALKGDDKADFETVLRLLPNSMRQDVSFVDLEQGKVYESYSQARGLSYLATTLGDNIFQSQSGFDFSMPASSDYKAEFNSQTVFSSATECKDSGTGPMRRVSTAISDSANRVNWIQATVYLPDSRGYRPEAGGFLEKLKDASGNTIKRPDGQDRIFVNGPFIYLGGWGSTNGTAKTAVDMGFQLSTGGYQNGVMANKNDLWTLVARAEGIDGSSKVFTDIDSSKTSGDQVSMGGPNGTRKFLGGQRVKLNFWNYDNILVISALELNDPKPRTIAIRLPSGSGWNGNGIGNIYKMMTTIGQASTKSKPPEGQRLQGDGYLNNVLWSDVKVGYFEVPKKVSDWPAYIQKLQSGQAGSFAADALIQIPPTLTKGLMLPVLTRACRFPDPNKISAITPNLQWDASKVLTGDLMKYVVQVKGVNDVLGNVDPSRYDMLGECVSVDLRPPTGWTVGLQLPLVQSPWNPPVPDCSKALGIPAPQSQSGNISSQAINVVPADLVEPYQETPPVVLTATVGQSASQALYLANGRGSFGSSMDYRIYPLALYPTHLFCNKYYNLRE